MTSHKLTRPAFRKLLALYMSPACGNNKAFIAEVSKTFEITEEDAYLIWMSFDVAYSKWFLRAAE